MSESMIEASGLCRYYGDFVAVSNVSFRIEKGSIMAFLGPNGAGKSTIIRMLTGYTAPSAGSARIGGIDVSEERVAASRMIGYLPENGPLYLDVTPAQYLKFIGQARSMDRQTLAERIEFVVESCKLETVYHKIIGKLSKGFRQRVGLAGAIIHDPEVLILDEPTSGLDPNQIHEVRDLLLKGSEKRTLVISTHILQEVSAIATDVLLIHDGRVVFSGPPHELGESSDSMAERFHALTARVLN